MTGTLYTTTSDNKVVDKDLTKVKDLTFQLMEECNMDRPTFIFQRDEQVDILQANYLWVDEWNAYYYLEAPTIIDFNRVRFDGRKDILMTVKTELLDTVQIITRSADPTVYNSQLNDPLFQAELRPWIRQKVLKTSAFNTESWGGYRNFVLSTTGDGNIEFKPT